MARGNLSASALAEACRYRQGVALTGRRRVGKSTIIYQIVEKLLQGTDPSRVFCCSFEEGGERERAGATEGLK